MMIGRGCSTLSDVRRRGAEACGCLVLHVWCAQVFEYLRGEYSLPIALPASPPPHPVSPPALEGAVHFTLTAAAPGAAMPAKLTSSVGGRQASVYGAPTADGSGYMEFDGKDDYVDLGPMRAGGPMSFGGWIKPARDARNWERFIDMFDEGEGSTKTDLVILTAVSTSTRCAPKARGVFAKKEL